MQIFDFIVRFVFSVLLNGLWEGAVLALGAFLALRAMSNANATTRHTVLAAALYASLILPLLTAAIGFVQSPVHSSAPVRVDTHESGPVSIAPAHVAVAQPAFAMPAQRPHFALPRWLTIAIVGAWLAGALVALARLLLGLGYLERLKRDALPVPVEYRRHLEQWTGAAKGSRSVRLCRSHNVNIPLAVGLFDAMILIPDHLLDELLPTDIDRILLHELAHLRRNDDWINVVERLAQAVLFFNPGVLWLISQLDLEREIACDDWVLQQSDALPYATCLEKVVTTALWPHRAMQAPGMFVTRRAMSVRIERLLLKHRDVRISASIVPTGVVVAVLTAVCVGALVVSPSFAYTTVAQPAPTTSIAFKATPHAVASPSAAPERVRTVVEYRDRLVPVTQTITRTIGAQTAKPKPLATLQAQTLVAAATPQPPSPGATPDYIDQLASAGYTNLTVDQLIELRGVGVNGPYIQDLSAAGLSHPSVRELTELRGVGVTGDYVRLLARAGYSGLTARQLVEARGVGIDANFLQSAAQHGFKNLPLEKLIELKATGALPQ